MITLNWKSFNVPTDRLASILKNLLSYNYDGIICTEENFSVMFKEEPSTEDLDNLHEFWENATEIQFGPSLREIISEKINEASVFGRTLILDFAVENVQMGITQANKTREVADYCRKIQRYVESGSLYAAIAEIDDMISTGVPGTLSPYVTEARLLIYKQKIEDFIVS